MSTETQEMMEMGTKPTAEHAWLNKLIGEWTFESEMNMPDGSTMRGEGTESTRSFGGLWALTHGKTVMPGGGDMEYQFGIGYDVSFKEYRSFMVMSVSSHLWKYTGSLSPDGRVMTLDCTGPHMEKDGETANYRDVMELIDENHRTFTSYGQDEEGNWIQFMKANFTRVA